MIKNKIIVIGGNHPNTLGLIRSVGEKGCSVYLFLEPCHLTHCNLRFSKYITQQYHLREEKELLSILHRDFWEEELKPIIICGSDASVSLIDSHYDELKEKFHFFNAGIQGRINYFMDKLNMFPLAEQCGLNTIKTWHVTDLSEIPENIIFPCLIKPNNSLGGDKEDIHICQNRSELIESLREGVDYLVQEYIEKDYELDINGFAFNNGKGVLIPAVVRKIRDYSYRQSDYVVLEDNEEHKQIDYTAITQFVREIGFEGLFSVEFLIKRDRAYFLEINLRNDGCGYLYTASGANLPYLWVLFVNGLLSSESLAAAKCKTPTFLMQQADFSNVVHQQVSFVRWLKDLLRTRAFFVLNIKDPKPFLYTIWRTLLLVLHKIHLIK